MCRWPWVRADTVQVYISQHIRSQQTRHEDKHEHISSLYRIWINENSERPSYQLMTSLSLSQSRSSSEEWPLQQTSAHKSTVTTEYAIKSRRGTAVSHRTWLLLCVWGADVFLSPWPRGWPWHCPVHRVRTTQICSCCPRPPSATETTRNNPKREIKSPRRTSGSLCPATCA